jgi:uncharacterized membrane protein YhaH (DUF805 family)
MPQSELTEPVGNETYTPKFFSLDGRIGRCRYWAYSIGAGLLMMPVLILVMGAGFLTGAVANSSAGGGMLGMLIGYGISFAITIILARRRLNDMGKSGWLGLLMLIPLVNFFFALWLLFGPGDSQTNEYGPPPGPNSTGVIILAWILPIIFFLGIIAAVALPAYAEYTAKARAAQMEQGQ